MRNEYDVIISGAGPAGATAAFLLARRGLRVLLVDRQAFPRDKACGDGLTPGTVQLLLDLGFNTILEKVYAYPIERMRFRTPGGVLLDHAMQAKAGSAGFHVIPRLELDDFLYRQALSHGAEPLQARVTGTLQEGGKVNGVRIHKGKSGRAIRAKMVLAAPGAGSAIARQITGRLVRDKSHFIAVRAYLNSIQTIPHCVEFFWLKDWLPGYAWIFPLAEQRANVGLGIPMAQYQQRKPRMEHLLNEFLHSDAIKGRLSGVPDYKHTAVWPIPMAAKSFPRMAYDGLLLAGDAAALVDPFSGEGLHNAILSGSLAAETIMRAVERNDFSYQTLRSYEHACSQAMQPILRRSHRLRRILESFPRVVDGFARLINRFPQRFAGLLSRHSLDFDFK